MSMQKHYKLIQSMWADAHYQNRSIDIFKWLEQAESPIEKIMGEALANIHCLAIEVYNDNDCLTHMVGSDIPEKKDWLFKITPQFEVGGFRVDFLVQCATCADVKLAIECDGHDFHEKTKEQAQRDKSRDRALMNAGVHVMRFTGSEIFRDPVECLQDVVDYFYNYTTTDKVYEIAERVWKAPWERE